MPLLDAVGGSLADRLRGGAGPATVLAEQGAENVLPVLDALAPLFPSGGLRRGSTVAVHASSSLVLALLAGASRAGAWVAVVGVPTLGLVAAAESGVALERLALVPAPGADLSSVVAALVDGMDLVVLGSPARLRGTELRRLVARARQRGAVLVGAGEWPGADLRLTVEAPAWHGLGQGHGYLRARLVSVRADGRGSAARPRRCDVWLPAAGGGISETEPDELTETTPGSAEVAGVEPGAWVSQAEAV